MTNWKCIFPLLLMINYSRITSAQTAITTANLKFDPKGNLLINPSESSSADDFDFLEGKWNIHNRKLESRLSDSKNWIEFDAVQEMRKVLTGLGNVENISATADGKPYEGMAVRLFDPSTKLWSIYWADNRSGTMDAPVVGSFKGGVGTFYGKDKFNGKDIILQFKWDATDRNKPVWSQAFSADGGKTWEWNWYMYFSKRDQGTKDNAAANRSINVLELRNYLIRPGQRDKFIDYFEQNFINSQNKLGGYLLGQYRVKDAQDNFFWMRGFENMASRNKFLNDFYFGPVWKAHKTVPNSLLLNNDNVYLLKPLNISGSLQDTAFNSSWFGKMKGFAVVDFFISNSKLDKLIPFVKEKYRPVLQSAGIGAFSFWVSEPVPNDFPALPTFQDKNLLVQITFYKDELEYQTKSRLIDSLVTGDLQTEMYDLVTVRNKLFIYPTGNSFAAEAPQKPD